VILLVDNKAEESKTLLELKAKKKAAVVAAPVPGQQQPLGGPVTPARQTDTQMSGTEAAAAVLNSVDEDFEDGAEAEVPDEFEVEDEGDEAE